MAKSKPNNPKKVWYRDSVESCFAALGTTEQGLGLVEVVKRLKLYGENALPAPKPISLGKIFARQFQSPLIYVLLIASVAVYFLGELTDTVVILAVLLINAAIGVFQEGRAQNTLLALENFTKTEAVVLREGGEEVVLDLEVVPGDVILLREGDKVPADARLFEVKNFKVDESALTGESVPISKKIEPIERELPNPADQINMVFRGSLVVAGVARAMVVATGQDTVIGKISREIISIDTEIPIKKKIRKLSEYIGIGVLVASALVFGVGLLYGFSIHEMFFTAVAVAVSLVPEGLPVVITLVLSIGAYRMAKQNALVKDLGAVEALGQASIIAVDKTGTITKNELMIERVYTGGKIYTVSGNGYESRGDVFLVGEMSGSASGLAGEPGGANSAAIDPANHPEILFAGKIASFCANARVLFKEKEGVWKIAGDPTEAALLVFGEKVGFHKDELEQEEPQIADLPFDSKLQYHATVHLVKKKSFLTVLGAPEAVLNLCKNIRINARSRKISEVVRQEIETQVHQMTKDGLRVIAFAAVASFEGELGVSPIHDAVFVGLFGMRDVLREGVREAVAEAQTSGLRTVMITGDHTNTAETIAREAGIFRPGDLVLTGHDLATLSKEEILRRLPSTSVFARVTPENKLEIIELFKKSGEIVVMTGDGVNDALSLVAADLGIAMGKIGTEVSKEAADIVLLDDNFGSIVSAIDEGRNIYQAIKRVMLYLFSTGLGELLTIVLAILIFLPLPVTPTGILWLNLVTDGFLVVSLAFEPRQKTASRINKTENEFFFDWATIIRAAIMAITMALTTIFIFHASLGFGPAKAYTMALTVLAALQWWNAWNIRSENESIFAPKMSGAFSNPYLIGATAIVAVLQLQAIYNPLFQKLLGTVALSFPELVTAVLVSLSVVLVEELRKFMVRRKIFPLKIFHGKTHNPH